MSLLSWRPGGQLALPGVRLRFGLADGPAAAIVTGRLLLFGAPRTFSGWLLSTAPIDAPLVC